MSEGACWRRSGATLKRQAWRRKKFVSHKPFCEGAEHFFVVKKRYSTSRSKGNKHEGAGNIRYRSKSWSRLKVPCVDWTHSESGNVSECVQSTHGTFNLDHD